ncbi:MAG: family 20 glycosylhydrolase, partial [Bacteroidales bacterium]|nr:family 20 glycosylhydrolase [Bacteroidales bacterium]
TIMPLPAKLTLNNDYFKISNDFGIEFKDYKDDRLEGASQRFLIQLSEITSLNFSGSNNLSLRVNCKEGNSEYPKIIEDESYILNVRKNRISLSASSSFGIIRGFETLLQMVEKKDEQWVIRLARIVDMPRFPWRGLMIDVCRHWIPKEVILHQIDAMAAVKLNVLHLHLTEHQGFRVESKVFPKLHKLGSNGNYYTQDDIHEIINYASNRGIRVLPEFDLPGHSASWFIGYPELASKPGPFKLAETFAIIEPVMNPANEEVYEFLDRFFQEMATLFPDEYLHIGGDEVNATHWEENKQIQNFMTENGIEDSHQLQAYFNRRIQKIIGKHGKKMVGWDEILNPELPKRDIVVQSWRSHESLFDAARNGYNAVLSSGLYLDHKLHADQHYNVDPFIMKGGITIEPDTANWKSWDINITIQGSDMSGAMFLFGDDDNLRGFFEFMGKTNSFEKAILADNKFTFSFESGFGKIDANVTLEGDSIAGTMGLSFLKLDISGKRTGGSDMEKGISLPELKQIKPLTVEQKSNILGGEACMWAEVVDSITIESRIWPRTAAIAEKLWSPENLTKDIDDMYRRLMQMDKYLVKRGMKYYENQHKLLKQLVNNENIDALKTLVDVLEEDKYYNRFSIYGEDLTTETPLNRTVDASMPESFMAYNFSKEVDRWLADPENDTLRKSLIRQLKNWEKNHQELLPVIQQSEQLKEIDDLSVLLSEVSGIALAVLEVAAKGEILPDKQKSEYLEMFEEAARSQAGMLLQIVPTVKKIVENY